MRKSLFLVLISILLLSSCDLLGLIIPSEKDEKSADASLASIVVVNGSTNLPVDLGSASLIVDHRWSTVTIVPTAVHEGATIRVDGQVVASGAASSGIPITVGSTAIDIEVTAEDGTTQLSVELSLERPDPRMPRDLMFLGASYYPGTDDMPGGGDDTGAGWGSLLFDAEGRLIDSAIYFVGPDATLRTSDDPVATELYDGVWQEIYSGDSSELLYKDYNGTYGSLELSWYDRTYYNAQGWPTHYVMYQDGPDGTTYTGDDLISSWNEYTYNGEEALRLSYTPGADGLMDTADDVLQSTFRQLSYNNHRDLLTQVSYTCGTDQLPQTADDVETQRYEYEYGYNSAGQKTSTTVTRPDLTTRTSTWEYDGEGRLVTWVEDFGPGGTMVDLRYWIRKYFYDEEGNFSREEILTEGTNGIPSDGDDELMVYSLYSTLDPSVDPDTYALPLPLD